MSLNFKQIGQALSEVQDPEIHISITELGLIYAVHVSNGEGQGEGPSKDKGASVKVQMSLTSPACPYGPMLIAAVHGAVAKLPGVRDVDVDVVFVPPWDPRAMASEECKDQLGIF